MIEKGYTLISNSPVTIDESDNIIKTFSTKKGTVAKILELECPDNSIIALCGTEHNGGCHNSYACDIELADNDNKQPFQKLHHSTALTKDKHIVAEIIVTKILQQDPPLDNKKVKEWSETISPILKLIGSNNNREHIMWMGAYPKFSSEFIKTSYTNNPDTDIEKVKFSMKVDMFEQR